MLQSKDFKITFGCKHAKSLDMLMCTPMVVSLLLLVP